MTIEERAREHFGFRELPINCPDGRRGCAVNHYTWTSVKETTPETVAAFAQQEIDRAVREEREKIAEELEQELQPDEFGLEPTKKDWQRIIDRVRNGGTK